MPSPAGLAAIHSQGHCPPEHRPNALAQTCGGPWGSLKQRGQQGEHVPLGDCVHRGIPPGGQNMPFKFRLHLRRPRRTPSRLVLDQVGLDRLSKYRHLANGRSVRGCGLRRGHCGGRLSKLHPHGLRLAPGFGEPHVRYRSESSVKPLAAHLHPEHPRLCARWLHPEEETAPCAVPSGLLDSLCRSPRECCCHAGFPPLPFPHFVPTRHGKATS